MSQMTHDQYVSTQGNRPEDYVPHSETTIIKQLSFIVRYRIGSRRDLDKSPIFRQQRE